MSSHVSQLRSVGCFFRRQNQSDCVCLVLILLKRSKKYKNVQDSAHSNVIACSVACAARSVSGQSRLCARTGGSFLGRKTWMLVCLGCKEKEGF